MHSLMVRPRLYLFILLLTFYFTQYLMHTRRLYSQVIVAPT